METTTEIARTADPCYVDEETANNVTCNHIINDNLSLKSAYNDSEGIYYYDVWNSTFVRPTMTWESVLRMCLESVIFVVSILCNSAAMYSLVQSRRRKSRVNLLIIHLTVADLLLTVFNIPLFVIWQLTIEWLASDAACRILMFVAMIGMYASPFLLIVISVDRFASIVFPLSVRQADMRCKIMLRVAWTACIIASIPQVLIHELTHPEQDPEFTQCVDYGFRLRHPVIWNIYSWFVTCTTYFIPLIVIVGCYTAIVIKIFGSSSIRSYSGNNGNRMTLRRSGVDTLPKARVRALQMTGAIVTAFIICWTPNSVVSTAIHISPEISAVFPKWLLQVLLSLMFSNACIDPIVYGMFTVDFRRHFPTLCGGCSGRRLPFRGRRISRRSTTTSSNNYPPTTYATSSRMGTTTAAMGNYHVITGDSRRGTAEKCV